MKKIESIADMTAWAEEMRAAGRSIGLVSTMGALHAGKEALLRAALAKADVVVVSIFVNPLQFGANELIARYPRSLADDLRICEAAGVHAVFVPLEEEMLPRGFSTFVTEEILGKPLDGQARTAHFRGVATVIAKLFNLIRPRYAFFGQKTAQRAAVVRKVSADLGFGVEVVVVPTAREPDGLAAGVANRNFTDSQRQQALAIHRALVRVQEMVASGVRSPDRLVAEATHVLGEYRRVRVIYVAVADRRTMEPVREIVLGETLLVIAAWVDEVRLIDNALLV